MRDLDRTSESVKCRLGHFRLCHRSDSHRIPLGRNLEYEGAPPRLVHISQITQKAQLQAGATIFYGKQVPKTVRH
jgi:hypothetical protein